MTLDAQMWYFKHNFILSPLHLIFRKVTNT